MASSLSSIEKLDLERSRLIGDKDKLLLALMQ